MLFLAVIPLNAQKYNFQLFDLDRDLEMESISSMANSPQGYLLLAGGGMVFTFDGINTNPLSQELSTPFADIRNLQADDLETLFLLANERLIQLGEVDPLINEAIQTYQLQGSKVFYGTKNGLKIFDRSTNLIDRPDALTKLENFEINGLAFGSVDSRNSLYITSSEGLFEYNVVDKTLDGFNQTDGKDLKEIVIDQSGRLWTYDNNGTIYEIDLNTKKTTPYYNEGFQINNLAIDSSNRIWIGTTVKGILRYDQSQDSWKTIDQSNGLSDNRVVDILTDSWGVVWIATADQVLSKFIDRDYELFTVYDGLASDKINAVFASDQNLIFSAGGKGVFEFGRNSFRRLYELDLKSEAIFRDSANLWIGTNGGGLIRVNTSESTIFRKNAGLPSDWVNLIAQSASGSIWIGTPSNGLAELVQRDSLGVQVIKYGLSEGLEDEHITALFSSRNGFCYYGTQSGKIGKIRSGIHASLSNELLTSEVTDIAENETGSLFFSTLADGLFKMSTGKNPVLEKLPGFPDNIKAISSSKGVLRVANDRGIYDGQSSFTVSDGFPSNNVTKRSLVNFQDRSWLGTMKGLLSIGALRKGDKLLVPKIHFEAIQVNYVSVSLGSIDDQYIAQIDYDQNQISFEYKGVDIHSSKELTYSYFLEGAEKGWSPWSKNANPSFNNLSAGNYTFQVKAKSASGAESSPLVYAFMIDRPFWKEWWFIPLLASIFTILAYLLFRSRIKVIRRKNEEEKAQLELKNRLLELEQKANQLQMNPHFIFNALNSIQATVAKEDYQDARREITDFAMLMRSILSNSKERVISLDDELLLLRKYIDIEKKCRTLSFNYEIEMAEGIDAGEVQIPPMLIQPFVENAIVHGLAKKEGGKLSIVFSLLEEKTMLVKVVDNGVGYETSKLKNASRKHKSVAIDVTIERLEALLEKQHQPAVKIQQISPDGGTEVALKIPIEYNF